MKTGGRLKKTMQDRALRDRWAIRYGGREPLRGVSGEALRLVDDGIIRGMGFLVTFVVDRARDALLEDAR